MKVRDFFIYSTGRFSIANGASSTQNIAIQADADFEVMKLTFSSDVAGAAQTIAGGAIPNATVLVTDSGSGRQLMNVAVPLIALFGNGFQPFILPTPRVFAARSNIQIVVTSTEAANTNNISLNFIGNKIFEMQG